MAVKGSWSLKHKDASESHGSWHVRPSQTSTAPNYKTNISHLGSLTHSACVLMMTASLGGTLFCSIVSLTVSQLYIYPFISTPTTQLPNVGKKYWDTATCWKERKQKRLAKFFYLYFSSTKRGLQEIPYGLLHYYFIWDRDDCWSFCFPLLYF